MNILRRSYSIMILDSGNSRIRSALRRGYTPTPLLRDRSSLHLLPAEGSSWIYATLHKGVCRWVGLGLSTPADAISDTWSV